VCSGHLNLPLSDLRTATVMHVLAAGSVVGFVIYTGAETRTVLMTTSYPETKLGFLTWRAILIVD
jgi:hypothetical protein